jgi:lysophospholipase L1-like esterase
MGAVGGALLMPMAALQVPALRRRVPRLGHPPSPATGTVAGDVTTLRLLGVGESTIAGVGVERPDDALTGAVARALAARTGRTVRWTAVGRNGATAAAVRRDLLSLVPPEPVDVILLGLGGNDLMRLTGRGAFLRELDALVAALIARTGARDPVVAFPGMPQMGAFPALPGVVRAVAGLRSRWLEWETIHWAARRPGHVHARPTFTGDAATFFASDGFHPSAAGYRAWGEAIVDAIDRAGRARPR